MAKLDGSEVRFLDPDTMSTTDTSTEQDQPTTSPRHRVSVVGVMLNLWEAAAVAALGTVTALHSAAYDLGLIAAGALVLAVTADLGTMVIASRRLLDMRHIRGVGLALVLSGALAGAFRLSHSSGPAWRIVAVTVICSALTGREALTGWGFGHEARQRRQTTRIVRHHSALVAEANTLPDDLRQVVLGAMFPAVWEAVCDAPHGLRNRLVEGDLS
jgi:hypothetical protein